MNSYSFVDGEYEVRNEIKHSVFIATVKGEVDAEGAEEFVRTVRKKYPDATHNCYAYISDEFGNATRFSDDGEPSGTAGQPILDVIKKQGLVKTAIVVTRYFGGIKLGAGGLVSAYSGAAADAVRAAVVSKKQECKLLEVSASYSHYALIDKLTRSSLCKVGSVEYDDNIRAKIFVPTGDVGGFTDSICELTAGRAAVSVDDGVYYEKL